MRFAKPKGVEIVHREVMQVGRHLITGRLLHKNLIWLVKSSVGLLWVPHLKS